MPLPVDAQHVLDRLLEFQRAIRDAILRSRESADSLQQISRSMAADTLYTIDAQIEPVVESLCREWGKHTPLVLIAEGLQDEDGREVEHRVFPAGTREEDAAIRVIIDPIDGTRGIMYDKRSAWTLAGVAPNRGSRTRLRDIDVAVMTELPTSKMGLADVLWAIRGRRAAAMRVDLRSSDSQPLAIQPSRAGRIDHGFATVSNFFPATKVLASETMEHLVQHLVGKADVNKAIVFDDQYISTGGQFYELIVGHDRFNADLRPIFYAIQQQPAGLCCHPYDCATMLIAEEAGVILTDGLGRPLDGPLDTTTGLSWAAYANRQLHDTIQPLLTSFLQERLNRSASN